MKVYSAPRTRSLRVVWLLEELGTSYELETVEFKPTSSEFFIQDTPTGKIPTLVDGEVVLAESGAILEYLLERYGEGSGLAAEIGSRERGQYLQWMHFAESTAWVPIGNVVWLGLYREGRDGPELLADARSRAARSLRFVEEQLGEQDFLLTGGFSAADIMMAFTLGVAQRLELMDVDAHPRLLGYLQRLMARDGFRRAAARVGGFD
ncbi:MAG: glutathione S-transferase family protein [Acidobacteriota bacterium]